MNSFHFRDSDYVTKRYRYRRPSLQFSMRTMIAFSLTCAAAVSIYRNDFVSSIAGISLLFAVFMFAEDIWPSLPR